MKRLSVPVPVVLLLAFGLAGCAQQSTDGWTTLIDQGLVIDNSNRTGDANWRTEDGGGYLVSPGRV